MRAHLKTHETADKDGEEEDHNHQEYGKEDVPGRDDVHAAQLEEQESGEYDDTQDSAKNQRNDVRINPDVVFERQHDFYSKADDFDSADKVEEVE